MSSSDYPSGGPRCIACNASEADCAYTRGCCPMCSHFAHLDEHGNSTKTGRTARHRRLKAVQ